MDVVEIYKCLCDLQRLRILNLLKDGPLCVCHLVEILDADQVKISKQLRYMKDLGMVEGERQAQWMVYRLADPDNPLIRDNLRCLQAHAGASLSFPEDQRKRTTILARIGASGETCPDLGRIAASCEPGCCERR